MTADDWLTPQDIAAEWPWRVREIQDLCAATDQHGRTPWGRGLRHLQKVSPGGRVRYYVRRSEWERYIRHCSIGGAA